MKNSANAVSAILSHDGEMFTFDVCLDRGAEVTQTDARPDPADPDPHGFVGDVHEALGRRGDLADGHHAARIAVPAIFYDGDVQIDDVALFQALIARNAVTDDVVHR